MEMPDNETTRQLQHLLEELDLMVCGGIRAMDLATDNHSERDLAKAVSRYEAAKAAYDAFRRLFPHVTY